MAKIIEESNQVKLVKEVFGEYKPVPTEPSKFICDSTGIEILIRKVQPKSFTHPSYVLLVKKPMEESFYHLSGLFRHQPTGYRYLISDNTKEKPKGMGVLTYNLFGISIEPFKK